MNVEQERVVAEDHTLPQTSSPETTQPLALEGQDQGGSAAATAMDRESDQERAARREAELIQLHKDAAMLLPGRPEAIDEARIEPVDRTLAIPVAPSYHTDLGGPAPMEQSGMPHKRRRAIGAAGLTFAVGSLAALFMGRGEAPNLIPEALARADVPTQSSLALDAEETLPQATLPVAAEGTSSDAVEPGGQDEAELDADQLDEDTSSISYGERTKLVRHGVFSEGKLLLHGRVPSQEVADRLVAEAETIFGTANVISLHIVDSEAPSPSTAPIFVTDPVRFVPTTSASSPDTAVVASDSARLLNLSAVLLTRNPNVTIQVLGYASSAGSGEENQTIADARVDAVFDFINDIGGNTSRLVGDPRGDYTPPSAPGATSSAQGDSWVELVISGLAA